ncbi:MAG: hypothetical protein JWP63_2106 [Candidatus Solibacter sp.]|nr:hypothetical protein [Candidatus Solibacter sp.]
MLDLNYGDGDDDSKWSNEHPRNGSNATNVLDNLIAAGKAKPIIVFMPNTVDAPRPRRPHSGTPYGEAAASGYALRFEIGEAATKRRSGVGQFPITHVLPSLRNTNYTRPSAALWDSPVEP